MGRDKLLLPWRGKTLIEHHLDGWLASNVERVVVVTRATASDLLRLLRGYRERIEIVVAEPAPRDMKQSVQQGLKRIAAAHSPEQHDAWLLAPADMPRLNANLVSQLCELHAADPTEIRIPVTGQRRGHPVLFPWPTSAAIFELGDAEGVNAVVARAQPVELNIDDPDILLDVDTAEAFRKLQQRGE